MLHRQILYPMAPGRITLSRGNPECNRFRFAAITLRRRSIISRVQAQLCGVQCTPGRLWNGRRAGRLSGASELGYWYQTSRVAPPI